ncbi:MAG: CgeB family protein, partial [Chitinophagaceae bacterium]
NVDAIDMDYYIHQSIFEKINFRSSLGPGVIKLNWAVKKAVVKKQYDIIWVDNKPYTSKSTLLHIKKNQPNAKIINLVTDDAFGAYGSTWGLAYKTAKFYDWHFVQRPENINEYKSCGANNVDFCFRSFNPEFHKPVEFTVDDEVKYKTSVGFVGTYEEDREKSIAFLISSGVNVSITGDNWQGKKYWDIIKPHYKGPSVYGIDYIKTINGMDICLHFLRKANRDSQDSRTFEIPACKVFMLAERSSLHELFFKENAEAVFFDNDNELLEKTKYYLKHSNERVAIANAGYEKCYTAGYTHKDRLKEVLKKIMNK